MRFKESALALLASLIVLGTTACSTPMYDPDRLFNNPQVYNQTENHFHSTSPFISKKKYEKNK